MIFSFKCSSCATLLICTIIVITYASKVTMNRYLTHWNEVDLGSLLKKEMTPLFELRGEFRALHELMNKREISRSTFNKYMKVHSGKVETFIGGGVHNTSDVEAVFDTLLSDKSKRSKGLFSLLNVVLLLGVILLIIGAGMVFDVYIKDFVKNMSESLRITVGYIIATSVTGGAYYMNGAVRPYVALLGALSLGGAYTYHLSCIKTEANADPALIISPVFAVWFALTLLFRSKMIGFITVGALNTMLGFVMYTGPLSNVFGFRSSSAIVVSFLASSILVSSYIAYVLQKPALSSENVDLFESGVLFLSTFTMDLALLILSSRYYDRSVRNLPSLLFYNSVAVAVGIGCFYIGALTPSLELFRGVASTFFVFFILQKWAELVAVQNAAIGVFGGGLLLFGAGYYVRQNPECLKYFV